MLVGAAAGLGALAFRFLIGAFQQFFFVVLGRLLNGWLGDFRWIVIPAVGGLIVGPMVYFLAREAKGHGVPEVMEAVALRGGRIRPRVAVVKALASSVCIGSGGSVGREGPIVQIGSALGSTFGQIFGLSADFTRTLVACGAAGGIAATFNAPLAGAFFALEVILRDWSAESFAPVVVSAFCATLVSRTYLGDHPAFPIPQYSVASISELPLFALLGVLCAFVGVAFILLLYWLEDRWDEVPIPEWLKPVPGGLLVGVVGTVSLLVVGDLSAYKLGVFGVGYEAISFVLSGSSVAWSLVAAFLLLKLLATTMTLGSGGSGGVFAPSLFMGCMAGAAFGHLAHAGIAGVETTPAAFALVGMGAVFAAASRAPVTAVLIVYEMTQDYRMILPLMLACAIALAIGGSLSRFSIYNLKLVRRGVHIDLPFETLLLGKITVADSMSTDLATLRLDQTLSDVIALADTSGHHGFPVLGPDGRLSGLVTMDDVSHALAEGNNSVTVAELATHDLIVAHPDETLNEAIIKLGERHLGRVPVVDREDNRHLLGILTRHDIIARYNHALEARHVGLHEGVKPKHFE